MTAPRVQVFSPAIGTAYCNPANNCDSGGRATIFAVGRHVLASPSLTALVAHGMPEQKFSYHVIGADANSVTPSRSNGVLYLGGAMGRYSLWIHNTTRTENMANRPRSFS